MPALFSSPQKLSPHLWAGMRIGILGGSFNPPHEGHIHASLLALKYLNLDAVWWLVSPANPLKNNIHLPPVSTRLKLCKDLTKHHPRIIISDIEDQVKTRRSFYTVKTLQKHFSKTNFIWLAGTDIAFEMHKWYRPKETLKHIPFAFIGRESPHSLCQQNYPKRLTKLSHKQLITQYKSGLTGGQIFWLLSNPICPQSSTNLRSTHPQARTAKEG